MYGIPQMKLEKQIIERRIQLMKEEGVQFYTNVHVGQDITKEELLKNMMQLFYVVERKST